MSRAPFALIGSALRHAAGIVQALPLSLQQHKLAGWVGRHVQDEQRLRIAELLGELAGMPFPDDTRPALQSARESAPRMADRIRDAWADLLAAECSAHPVVLVLEDLHWGDLPSMKLVQFALSQLRDIPLTVLGLARPEVHEVFPKLWLGHSLQETRLGELSRRAAESLVRSALGSTVDAQQVAEIVDRGRQCVLPRRDRPLRRWGAAMHPETVRRGEVGVALDATPTHLRAAAFSAMYLAGGCRPAWRPMASSSSEQLLSVLRTAKSSSAAEPARANRNTASVARCSGSAYAMLTEAIGLGHSSRRMAGACRRIGTARGAFEREELARAAQFFAGNARANGTTHVNGLVPDERR
jgi:hypothetical protein